MSYFKKEHLWIGTTNKTKDEYFKYFEMDYSTEGDFDDPNYKVCGFCKDIDDVYYDEDFLLAIDPLEKEVSIKEILGYDTLDTSEIEKVIEVCHGLNIKKANCLFSYALPNDEEIEVKKPYKNSYNDLKYIGIYKYA